MEKLKIKKHHLKLGSIQIFPLFKMGRFVKWAIHLKNSSFILGGLFSLIIGSCEQGTSIDKKNDGLEMISVDLSKSRNGRLSEFFEPEVAYIWLEDDSEEAQLNSGLQKILIHRDKIYTLDIYGCKCIQIFDKSGKYLAKIDAYGGGPGEYLDFDDAAIVNEELVLLGIRKLMWFSLEGEFLRELSFRDPVGSGIYAESDHRYYLYSPTRDPGDFLVKSFNESIRDTVKYLPYDPDRLYGHDSGRSYFQKSRDSLYFGRMFLDTIYQISKGKFIPKLVFDFGKYAQDLEELKKITDIMERLNFMNNSAKLYFRGRYLISEKQLYTVLVFEKKAYQVFYDRNRFQTHVIEGKLVDDIDGGYDPFDMRYNFEPGKVGIQTPGKDLYNTLIKKQQQMGQEDFESWIKDNGENFAKTALAAKDSENPVLIVYEFK